MSRFFHLCSRSFAFALREAKNSRITSYFYCQTITFLALKILILQISFAISVQAKTNERRVEAQDTLANPPILGLAEIEITAQNPYQDVQLLGSQYGRLSKEVLALRLASHMGSIAQEFSSAYVQTNGPGSLALLSQRGLPASRTQVVWNGFRLNHPMLGVVDLSLISSSLFDAVLFTPGLGQARYGQSGAGSMHILQQAVKDDRIALQHSLGSFGAKQTRLHATSSKDNISWDLRLYRKAAENNFEFKKRVFDPEQRAIVSKWFNRENNDTQSYSVLFNVKKEASRLPLGGTRDAITNRSAPFLRSFIANSEYQSTIWAFIQDNNIPGSKLAPSLRASQSDAFLRWMQGVRWGSRNHWRIQHFIHWQSLDFKDPDKEINSDSDIWSSILRLEHQNTLGKHAILQSLVEWSMTSVNSTDYELIRSRWSLLHRHTIHGEFGTRNTLRVDVNQAYYNDFGWNWSGELGWKSKLSRVLGLRILSAKHSVIPTFNDLYWPVLGNSDLNSEQVYSVESGLEWAQTPFEWDGGQLRADVQLSYYWNTVNNGIRWLPDNQGLSRPLNIEAITSRGVESDIALAFQHAQFSGVIKSGIYQVIAYMDQERYSGDPARNKQLRYTPEWQFKHYVYLRYNALQFMLSNSYVAERYSSSDHSSPFDPLSSYSTWNAAFGVDIPWSAGMFIDKRPIEQVTMTANRNSSAQPQWKLSWKVKLNNIFSESYEQVLNYPMPGRHFMLSIQLQRVGSASRAVTRE